MKYYVYTPRLPDNKTVSRKVIHTEDCIYVKDPEKERNWHGPFDDVTAAELYAMRYHMDEGKIKSCKKCNPER